MDETTAPAHASKTLPLGLLAAAGFLSVAGARIVDPLLSLIAHDFATTVPEMSIIIAAFTLPYGLNQLLLGPIGDRYGKLRVMLGALTCYTVFTSACATASGLGSLTVLRACAGASSAGLIPVCLAYIGDAVPYEQRQLTLSRFATGIVIAQIMAGPLGGMIGEFAGWRAVSCCWVRGAGRGRHAWPADAPPARSAQCAVRDARHLSRAAVARRRAPAADDDGGGRRADWRGCFRSWRPTCTPHSSCPMP